jgi:hypothetical protein
MAYDEELAARIRERLHGATEKTMFGGRVFLMDGTIAVGVYREDLLVRVDPDTIPDLVAKAAVKPFMMGGRATRGFVLVPGGEVGGAELERWIGVARACVAALPARTDRRRGRAAR